MDVPLDPRMVPPGSGPGVAPLDANGRFSEAYGLGEMPGPGRVVALPPEGATYRTAYGPSRIGAHGYVGFAAFCTWWLLALVLIPVLDGNRLSWVHVVFAVVGAPLAGYLWWVAVRMLRDSR